MSTEIKAMSDKALKRKRRPRAAASLNFQPAGDPGRGLAPAQAQPLRDQQIKALRAAKAEAQAARAELAKRETEKQTVRGRIFATEAANKRRKENTRPTPRPNGWRFTPS